LALDGDLKHVRDLKQLESLSVFFPVSDAGLKDLKELGSLNQLFFGSSKITDAGAKELKAFKQG
jgi:hypothetical protein